MNQIDEELKIWNQRQLHLETQLEIFSYSHHLREPLMTYHILSHLPATIIIIKLKSFKRNRLTCTCKTRDNLSVANRDSAVNNIVTSPARDMRTGNQTEYEFSASISNTRSLPATMTIQNQHPHCHYQRQLRQLPWSHRHHYLI